MGTKGEKGKEIWRKWGIRTCKDKRERESESKGLKEKAVLEFKVQKFLERKGVKSFCKENFKILSNIFIRYIQLLFHTPL